MKSEENEALGLYKTSKSTLAPCLTLKTSDSMACIHKAKLFSAVKPCLCCILGTILALPYSPNCAQVLSGRVLAPMSQTYAKECTSN